MTLQNRRVIFIGALLAGILGGVIFECWRLFFPPIRWGYHTRWHGLGARSFQLSEFPEQSFLLTFPESINAREMAWRAAPVWKMGRTSAEATWTENRYSYHLRLTWRRTKKGAAIDWKYTFVNRTFAKLTDVTAFNCFLLAGAPLFFDGTLERTWISAGNGEKIWLSTVDKSKGVRPQQFYLLPGGYRLNDTTFFAGHTAPLKVSGDRIGVVSKDGRWMVESVVEGPVAYFFTNSEPDHGCIHASPLFGDIAHNQSAVARGSIVFTRLRR